jgi:hypothetical protein
VTGRRRRTAAATVIVLVLMTAILLRSYRSERESGPAALLEAKLVDAPVLDRFRFLYSAAGTRVNDCFEPNRSFLGDVDHQQGLLILRRDPSSPPIAYVTGGRAVLSASLFRDGTVPTPWLTTAGPVKGALRASLLRALGTGLAGYVVDGKLPPRGADFARDGLEVAKEVTRLPGRDGARRFALRLDRNALPGRTSSAQPLLEDPTLELWIGASGNIRRIAVRPGRPAATSANDLDVGGWTIDYLPPIDGLSVPDLGPFTEVAAVDAATLAAPPIETCELPLTADP